MQETFRNLSDFFFIMGTLCAGLGVLSMVSGAGGFDGLAYIWYILRVRCSASRTKWEARKSFLDYRETRREKYREKSRRPGRLILVGLIAVAVSAVFAVLYTG